MQKTKIILNSVASVRDFVQKVIVLEYEVDLVQGRYVVDAKSIMGIFALDTLTPILVEAHTECADAFFESIKDYIVED